MKIKEKGTIVNVWVNETGPCAEDCKSAVVEAEIIYVDHHDEGGGLGVHCPYLICFADNRKYAASGTVTELCCQRMSVDRKFLGKYVMWLSDDRCGIVTNTTVSAKKFDGCRCIECLAFVQMASPNYGDDFVCCSCRDSKAWKYKARR